MPESAFGYDYGDNLGPMVAAWAAHLIGKGCHPVTAKRKADERVRRKRTWPPTDGFQKADANR